MFIKRRGVMSTFSELLLKRRSVREFEKREVPLSITEEIIKESCLAPNARNEQPLHFIIINNGTMIKKLSDESKRAILEAIEENPDYPLKHYEAILRNQDFNVFWDAPCLVYIVGPENKGSLQVDCALAASYFMLSAASRGLGTCWVALGSCIKDPEIRKEIGLPDNYRIVAPIILGYPRVIPEPPPREDPKILKVVS
jgi:nitroreductase